TGSKGINIGAMSSMNIEDISVVRNMTKLKEINLSVNPRLKDISIISVCEKMEEVSFQNCTQLEDVSVLGNLKELKKINLNSCPKIRDLYFLRNLPKIEELKYNGTIVYTPGLITILKLANGIDKIEGNDSDMMSKTTLVSGKKKNKLQKAIKKYVAPKNDDSNSGK
ncbi:MAG: leucine-rich repeat protein, partial [Rickettsiales bacterium]|nr:leucine-rich repeat protein [Rickettsiales bacterium]